MSMNEERLNMWVESLADVLNRLCLQNESRQVINTPMTKFRALRLPKITISAYIRRIVFYSNCSEECFVIALIYIERLVGRNKNFFINEFNVHRLILTSVMLAAKYYDDNHFDNAYYSRVGGLSCKEINELERELLLMINFNVHVENELFTAWNKCLISHHRWIANMSLQYELMRFEWDNEVVSAMASILSVPEVMTPIKGFPRVVYGYAANVEESFVSQRSKPNGSSCSYQMWQYRNQNYNTPSNLSESFKPNLSIQTR